MRVRHGCYATESALTIHRGCRAPPGNHLDPQTIENVNAGRLLIENLLTNRVASDCLGHTASVPCYADQPTTSRTWSNNLEVGNDRHDLQRPASDIARGCGPRACKRLSAQLMHLAHFPTGSLDPRGPRRQCLFLTSLATRRPRCVLSRRASFHEAAANARCGAQPKMM